MPIKQVFEKREDAPEWLRGSLVEDGGKFVFEAETATEIAGLKQTISTLRLSEGELAKLKKQIEGLDLEEAKKAIEAAKKAEAEKLKAQGDWDTREANLKQQLTDQFTKQYAPVETENKKLKAAVEKHLKEAAVRQALAPLTETPDLILPHILNNVAVVEENGEFVARVTANGQVRIGNAKGEPMTIAQLIEADFLNNKSFAPAFKASGSGGSGAGPSGGGGGGGFRLSRDEAKDPAKYRAAKEAAVKAGQELIIAEN